MKRDDIFYNFNLLLISSGALVIIIFFSQIFRFIIEASFLKITSFIIYLFFLYGTLIYIKHRILLYRHFNKVFNRSSALSNFVAGKESPHIAIFVPARNEGYVIENTIRRLSKMNYPKDKYSIFIIVDERELKDDVEVFTKTVSEKTSIEMTKKYNISFVHTIEVPEWYSGVFGSLEKTYKKSTKGRALNYALLFLNNEPSWQNVDLIGILDADGRLDFDVLREVAYNRLSKNSKILQGPVFQISNFKNITLTGIAAGLELGIHHMTELPSKILNDRVQFLAGTNYFIDKDIITKVGGWDQDTLVEDAELAIRIYCEYGIKTEWLNSPELEQSPENIKIYTKQRERWARGHLHLIKYVLNSSLSLHEKINFFKKILFSQTRFLIDFFVPFLAIFLVFNGYLADLGNFFQYASVIFFIASVFIFDLYGFVYRKLTYFMIDKPTKKQKFLLSFKLFVFMPFFMCIQTVPRIKALGNFVMSRTVDWYKTERTKELIIE
ncbi:MAG: hypothetical protein QG594_1900 [Bacteroidota bacterium]|nr:hypothetical protein [Bacteroidota bacterium]